MNRRRYVSLFIFLLLACLLGWVASVVHRVERKRAAISVIEENGYGGVRYACPEAQTWCGDGEDREEKRRTWRGWVDDLLYDVDSVMCLKYSAEVGNAIRDLATVHHVAITGGEVQMQSLRVLADLPHLEILMIWGVGNLDDETTQILGHLVQLKTLRLHEIRVSDSGLRFLQALQSLEEISLHGVSWDGSGLRYLQSCQELRKLSLCKAPLTDEGMKEIGCLVQLEDLEIIDCGVDARSLVHLAPLHNLQRLFLADDLRSETSFSNLPPLPNLTILWLAADPEITYSLRCLPDLPNLGELGLSDMDVTDEDVMFLARKGVQVTLDGKRWKQKGDKGEWEEAEKKRAFW